MIIKEYDNINDFFIKERNHDVKSLTIGGYSIFHKGHRNILQKLSIIRKNCLIILKDCKKSNFCISRESIKNSEISDYLDYIYVIHWTQDNNMIKASIFVRKILMCFPQLKTVIHGEDWRFGHNREGSKTNFKEVNINTLEVETAKIKDQKISSTHIWNWLEVDTTFNLAMNMILTKPSTIGFVVKGQNKGKEIGFPTINISWENRSYIPPIGIYYTKVKIPSKSKLLNAVTNIGYAPTLNNDILLRHETHIMDFNSEIYNQRVECFYFHKYGIEKKHANKKDLQKFIEKIRKDARIYFNDN